MFAHASFVSDPLFTAHLSFLAVERRLAPVTVAKYRRLLVLLHHFWAQSGVSFAAIERAHVAAWLHSLPGSFGPASTALAYSCWSGFFHWAVRRGFTQVNPMHDLRRAVPAPQRAATLGASAVAQLLQVAALPTQPAHLLCLLSLVYGAGLRISEALQLDAVPGRASLGWVDVSTGLVHVVGKGGTQRVVPVGQAALLAYQQWVSRRPLLGISAPALFTGTRGQRLTASVARLQFVQLARASGLSQHLHPHMLRHSFALHCVQSGLDLRDVQALMGHRSLRSTQVYTQHDFSHLQAVYRSAHPRA